MSYINIDVDLDDIVSGLSDMEKQELVDDLYEDGYVPTELEKRYELDHDDFSNACKKLIGQSWRLTTEEEEFVINLSKKF